MAATARTATLDEVPSALRAHAGELRRAGVLHAAVFGSVARRDDRPDSDVDLLVVLDPDLNIGLLELVGIGQRLEMLLGRPVDVLERDRLGPSLREEAEGEAVDAL